MDPSCGVLGAMGPKPRFESASIAQSNHAVMYSVMLDAGWGDGKCSLTLSLLGG